VKLLFVKAWAVTCAQPPADYQTPRCATPHRTTPHCTTPYRTTPHRSYDLQDKTEAQLQWVQEQAGAITAMGKHIRYDRASEECARCRQCLERLDLAQMEFEPLVEDVGHLPRKMHACTCVGSTCIDNTHPPAY